MSMIKEFKEFAMKGNLVDMAVAVVMAGAFGKVVSAFIDGMIMPIVSLLTGGTDFSNKYIPLAESAKAAVEAAGGSLPLAKAKEAGAVFAYGQFITVTIEFLIIAFVVFMIIKAINKMKKAEEAAAPAGPTPDQTLLSEIRDLLKK